MIIIPNKNSITKFIGIIFLLPLPVYISYSMTGGIMVSVIKPPIYFLVDTIAAVGLICLSIVMDDNHN